MIIVEKSRTIGAARRSGNGAFLASITSRPERSASWISIFTSPGRSRRCAADFAQGLQGADPAFVARAPGLDARADPDLFLGQLLVELGVLPGLGLQGRLLAIQVRRVVARPAREPAAVEFQDAGRHFAEQGPIVRDEQQRAAVAQQEILQPADGVDVEVVGRLVQQQEVRAADHGLGQQHAAFHAGGKGRHVGVRLEAHPRDDGFDLLVHAPAAVGLQGVLDAAQLRLQVVASLAGQPARQVMILGQQFRLGPETPGDLVEDRAVQVLRHFLGEHGGPQALLPDDLAAIGLQVPWRRRRSVVLPVPLRPKRHTRSPGSIVRLA